MSDTFGSVIEFLLPNYQDRERLLDQSREINALCTCGDISESERDALLADLVNTAVIAAEANEQEQKILLAQVVKVLSMMPIG
jgi:hypothetical protein